MSNPIITIHNVSTNEIVEREMTNEELELHLALVESEAEAEAIIQAEAEAKEVAKAAALAKLEALGLTAEEIQAILN